MSSLRENYAKKFKNMYEVLEKKLETNNTFTVESFRKYEPLFQKENREIVDKFMYTSDYDEKEEIANKIRELDALTDEFYKRIDPFRDIKIVDNDGNELFKLAPSFFNPKTIEEDEDLTVATNVNLSGLEPRYRDGAFNRMLDTWSENQLDADNLKRILNARESYRDNQRKFQEVYGKGTLEENDNNSEIISDDDDDWEII